jgi:hypothetical protein
MKAYEIKNININRDDIFDYVVGNSNYDPIERCIDCKSYEVFDEFIYNNETKETIEQDKDFNIFSKQVSLLRSRSSKMNMDEILRICEELEEIAPKYIKL